MKTEFLKPRLVGTRFEEHSIPVEVLKDWTAFEGLIVQAARWLYLEENPKRKRMPRGSHFVGHQHADFLHQCVKLL